ncbi:sensor histidine kinase [Butyrivibrio sp. XB500-5]|uniref:sensor histidine kinase n=1 Tax=Butyrivibrio sp. XB500-5 TaxID=2364880 RepID=UPI000EA92B2D|nr:HAMP domain-containing sensor histidine kinase [Butyrivibrio sp. XB500-5]RKM62663.1 sensor histidine kinase [Butyrivibrio sp. XB500-5]
MKDNRLGRINVRSVIQHFLAAFIVLILLFSMLGTNILINGVGGDISYSLHEADKSRPYEESYLFNNILGNNISNVLRLVAQRSQLEMDGQYDGDKIIDVTAYVNRGSVLLGGYITAHYRLSDLLKWAQNGFETERKDMTAEECEEFLAEETTYTHLKNNIVSGGMNSYLSSQLDQNSITSTKPRDYEFQDGQYDILKCRYQTADGKNIEEIVSNWDEYNTLRQSVESASVALLSSYNEYVNNISYYSYQNTNLRYYVSRTINDKTDIYTNVRIEDGENILDKFKKYGKYIYYCPNELSYETNTLIKENIVRSMIKNYSYAYPDQIKVYIGVDTNAYPCEDDFTQGKAGFTKYSPYRSQLYFFCAMCAFIYILLLIVSISQISVIPETTENRTATELITLRGLAIMAVPLGITYLASMTYKGSMDRLLENPVVLILVGIGVFIADIGLLDLIYNLTEKGKSGLLWKDSLIKKLVFGAKDVVVNTTNNASVIVRTWVPYAIFVVINILLVLIGIPGIVIAVIMDIMIGVFVYRQNLDRDKIIHVIENIKNGDVSAKVDVENLRSDNVALAEAVNSIGDGIKMAVDTSMKDEKMKADLITNVSHDIKTPLTSIINYVDLIKREKIDNDKVKEYVDVLDQKSQKLKQLTEDLVEVAKISSGNININLQRTDFVELVNQTIGEFYEKFEDSKLTPIFKHEAVSMCITADAHHLWRVIENLLNNVCKYALSGTRVYMDMKYVPGKDNRNNVEFSIKNISATELNVDVSELTERFIRGDVSRATEGSGLGLSIAKNLTVAQNGSFDIKLDGDLFKVVISFEAV